MGRTNFRLLDKRNKNSRDGYVRRVTIVKPFRFRIHHGTGTHVVVVAVRWGRSIRAYSNSEFDLDAGDRRRVQETRISCKACDLKIVPNCTETIRFVHFVRFVPH